MYQNESKTRLQAEKIVEDRLQLLIHHYPNKNELKGLGEDETYRKLEICYGSDYIGRALNISLIEAQIKAHMKKTIIGFSIASVGLIVWTAILLFMYAIPALQINSGSIQTWTAVIATIIVDCYYFGYYLVRNIKAMISGKWNLNMDKKH